MLSIVIFVISFTHIVAQESIDDTNIQKLVKLNNLTYLDTCDYSKEQERKNYTKSLLNLLVSKYAAPSNTEKHQSDTLELLSGMANINGSLCNMFQNLACNNKGICNCAIDHEFYGFKLIYHREGDSCVLSRGSICVPEELLEYTRHHNPIKLPKKQIRCKNSTTCVVNSSGMVCNMVNLQEEIERIVNDKEYKLDPVGYIVQKTKEGFCTCKDSAPLADFEKYKSSNVNRQADGVGSNYGKNKSDIYTVIFNMLMIVVTSII